MTKNKIIMNIKLPGSAVCSKINPPSILRRFTVCLLAGLAFTLPTRAAFHLWNVSEVYSSTDGKVQFIELSTASSSQQFVNGQSISSVNSNGTQTFTFPSNLPSDTANKSCIIGTSNLSSFPGGVVPDFIIPNNFIQPAISGGSATVTFNGSGSAITYTNLPIDGDLSLTRSGGIIISAINSPKNFSSQSNTIVPVKFLTAATSNANLVLSFRTATGVNGSAGTNYAVEAQNQIGSVTWTTATNVTGNGTTKSVAIPIMPGTNQFFRLRVP